MRIRRGGWRREEREKERERKREGEIEKLKQSSLLLLSGARASSKEGTKKKAKGKKTRLLVPVPGDCPGQLVARASPGHVEAEDGSVAAEGADLFFLGGKFEGGRERSGEEEEEEREREEKKSGGDGSSFVAPGADLLFLLLLAPSGDKKKTESKRGKSNRRNLRFPLSCLFLPSTSQARLESLALGGPPAKSVLRGVESGGGERDAFFTLNSLALPKKKGREKKTPSSP